MIFEEVCLTFRCRGHIMWFSKFFGPSPRKQRLTVYSGLQVQTCMHAHTYVRAHACKHVSGSKNLFQRAILFRHKRIYLCQGRLLAIRGKKWLEELASESNTIQAQEDIMSARVMANNIRPKLYINLRWLFDDISGLLCSFELSSFVNLDMVSLLPWIAAGSSRKSI